MAPLTLLRLLAPLALLALFAWPAAAQRVVPDVIVVKLRPAANDVFRASRRDDGRTSALPALDAVGRAVGAVEVRPVLPENSRFAARHRAFGMDRWYVVRFSRPLAPQAVADAYAALGAVEVAEVQYEHRISDPGPLIPAAEPAHAPPGVLSPVDDPMYPQQWHYDNTGQWPGSVADTDIDLPEAWATGYTGAGVVVAVLDTGSDLDHPDLAASLWTNPGEVPGNGHDDDGNGYADDVYGIDPLNGDSDPSDDHDHGTHTAGTIAAVTNNGVGVAGVAPGARIMSLKICDESGSCHSDAAIAASFAYAADMGAAITSNSWLVGPRLTIIEDAIAYFNANGGGGLLAGGLTIFSNGNANLDCVNPGGFSCYPASYPFVVAVAAVGFTNARAFYSNYGVGTAISAPGGDQNLLNPQGGVLSTVRDGYAWFQGTSMAAPHVSGVAALVVQANVGASPADIRARLTSTAGPVNDPQYTAGKMGAGLVNAAAALDGAGPPPPPPGPPVASASPLSFDVTLGAGVSTTAPLDIANTAAPGSRLLSWSSSIEYPFSLTAAPPERAAGTGSGARTGGADAFGYQWIDSNEPGGPTYSWTDISGIGTPGPTGDVAQTAVIFPAGFTFPFYGADQTAVLMSTNGFLTFSGGGAGDANDPIPDASDPNNVVAPFWDDLDVTGAAQTDTYFDDRGTPGDSTDDRYIAQWTNVPRYEGVGTYSFQAVLYASGDIEFYYNAVSGELASATVGIENATGTVGLEVAANALYVENGLAVRFRAATAFARLAPGSGLVAAGSSQAPIFTFDAENLGPGTYTATLHLVTSDPANPSFEIPLTLTVLPPVASVSPGALSVTLAPDATTTEAVTISNTAGLNAGDLTWSAALTDVDAGPSGCADGQELTVSGGVNFGVYTAFNGTQYGQSFTAPCDGVLTTLQIPINGGTTLTGHLRLYAGDGTGGVQLAAAPFSDVTSNTLAVAFPTPVRMRAGGVYTWFLDLTDGFGTIANDITAGYGGGTAYAAPNGDPASAAPQNSDLYFTATFASTTWVTIAPTSGTVAPGAGDALTVTLDATGLAEGPYTATLNVTTNDPANPSYEIPLTLTVAALSAPVAVADTLATDEDVALDVPAPGVLGNDADPNGDALTAALVDGPAHAASFTLNADGSFAYTPAPDYHGPDGFTYTADDGTASSAVTAVTLTVHAVNDAPVADAGDDQTASADSTGYAAVTLDGTGSADVDGDTLTYSWKEDGTEIATGEAPNVSLAVGLHEVILTVTDPSGAADADTVAVTVEAPVPPLTVTLTPTDPEPPVVIARGGRVYFDLTFEVGPTGPSSFQYWTEAVLPSGNERGPLVGPNTVLVTPPATVTLSLSQRVPFGVPPGAYTYRVKAGTHPGVVLDEDAIVATVVEDEALAAGEGRAGDAWVAYDAAGRLMEPGITHDLRTATATAEAPSEASAEAPAAASLVAGGLPSAYALHAAAPNPFATATALRYDLPEGGHVRLAVYDVLGREVAVLVDAEREAVRHEVVLDGRGLPAGVYLVHLTAGGFVQARRVTLLR